MPWKEKNRELDGGNNNAANPTWGRAGQPFRRSNAEVAYGTGGTPSGAARPNPRCISNDVCKGGSAIPDAAGLTDFTWAWGQFILHDLALTRPSDTAVPIPVCTGDPDIKVPIGLQRSSTVPVTRNSLTWNEQVNFRSSYLDASVVYGTDSARADALRMKDGSGKLRVSLDGGGRPLLPLNTGGLPNQPDPSATYFLAGDERANENVALTALHSVFVREHNRVCDALAGDPDYKDADLGEQDRRRYQRARKWVGALIQSITFNEFLPAILGGGAIGPWDRYHADVNATVSNLFATVAFRFGHSMLSATLKVGGVALPIQSAFFNPQFVIDNGVEAIFNGLAGQAAQEIDPIMVEALRTQTGSPPRDLAAVDIQRGRDHGLPDFATYRKLLKLPPVDSVADMTANPSVQDRLTKAYGGSVTDLDAWIGMLAEDHVDGAQVGLLALTVLADQFQRLRNGDAFWFENDLFDDNNRNGFKKGQIEAINKTRLSTVIKRNCDSLCDALPDDVFHVVKDEGIV